ncbi:MAG: hypothetical protein Q9208_008060 [Pyrenodesmia sp. 3 TL-2023]
MKLFEEGSPFIPDLLRQTHGGFTRGRTIDVLLAVVDKIPHRVGPETDLTGNGISVLLLDTQPNLWQKSSPISERIKPSAQRRSTLSFQFGREGSNDATPGPQGSSFLSRIVKLPVSNTVFHNGRKATIQAQQWVVAGARPQLTLRCLKTSYLDDHVVKMFQLPTNEECKLPLHSSNTQEPETQLISLDMPFQSVTLPRVVAGSMGNVIRGLFANGSSGIVIPASQELEAAVDRWISSHEAKEQAVAVWALISPAGTVGPSDKPSSTDISQLLGLLNTGSTLHRVLSGGGGWGNRQGLLALDPELDFNEVSEFSASSESEDEDPEAERRRNLSQIVSPGDTVEFFMCRNAKGISYDHSTKYPFSFGTTPSTVDEIPSPETLTAGQSERSPCIYLPTFGMLSEEGMSLTTVLGDGQRLQTKIDAPFARLSFGAGACPPPEIP